MFRLIVRPVRVFRLRRLDHSCSAACRSAGGASSSNGTVFRLVEYGPGVVPRNHRTESIDYAIVMSGEIDMEMDGTTVHLKAGDVLVQRGTIHNWINTGTAPCVIAFALIDGKPATVLEVRVETASTRVA